MNCGGQTRRHPLRPWNDPETTYVEVPNPEEWQATVDRAKAARADSEWQQTEGVNP